MDLVTPQGPESASIMFILDSATEEDAKIGRAFSGRYTNDIKALCRESGIDYNGTYRTLYIKEKLTYGGKNRKQKNEAIALAHQHFNYEEILANEIAVIQPKIICPLGELAFRFTSGNESISKFRGSILPAGPKISSKVDSDKTRIIPTMGPEYIIANQRNRVFILLDYQKIALYGQQGVQPFVDRTITWIADSVEKLNNYVERYPDAPFGVFDIETRYNLPVCIGFCFSPTESVCVPLLDPGLTGYARAVLWKRVDELLRSRRWVNQNIKFDINILERVGFRVPHIIGDTALRSSFIYPELPKNLGFLNSIYTDMPYFKDEGKDTTDRNKLYIYCAKDCLSTFNIHIKQEEEIKDLELEDFSRKEQELFHPYVRLERRGILIDEEARLKLLAKYVVFYNTHSHALNKACNKSLNPASPKQVAEVLYNYLHLPERKNRTTGALLTDEETLEEFLVFHVKDELSYKIISLIEACRKLHKVIEFLVSPIHPDNRLRCSYDLGGAVTGRTVTKRTSDYFLTRDNDGKWVTAQAGRPFQNIGKHGFKIGKDWYGKDLRSIFVPTPGFILCEGDLSQAESRVDCVLARDFEFLREYDSGPGIHKITGSWVFSCDPDEIIKGSDRYFIGKTVRHAGERGMGPDRLARMIREPMDFCRGVLEMFHKKQENIRKVYHAEVIAQVRSKRVLVSPHGFRRDFFGKPDHEMDMEAISQIPQATVGKQIQFSLPLLEAAAPYARFNYEGHDALMAEIPRERLYEYSEVFKRVVERPIDFRGCSISRDFDLIIPAEVSWSDTNWMEMRDVST